MFFSVTSRESWFPLLGFDPEKKSLRQKLKKKRHPWEFLRCLSEALKSWKQEHTGAKDVEKSLRNNVASWWRVAVWWMDAAVNVPCVARSPKSARLTFRVARSSVPPPANAYNLRWWAGVFRSTVQTESLSAAYRASSLCANGIMTSLKPYYYYYF